MTQLKQRTKVNNRPRVAAAAAAGLAAAMMLAACGGDNGDDAADTAADPTEGMADDASGEAAEGEEYSWSLGETHVEDYPTTHADVWFADTLRERTGGRIDITVFHSAQLGEERDVLEQVQLGAAEMTRTSAGPVSEFVPEWAVFSLPYVFDDADHLWRFLEGDYAAQMLEGLREGGYVGLAYYDAGARNFYTTDGPVNTPEDLAGLNIRVQPGAVPADMIEAMGGSPVVMDFGEVYSSLQTGVIDGAENNEPSYVSTGHYEVATYFTLDGHTRVPEVLLINADLWDSLSAEDQQLIRDVAQESIAVQRELWDAEVESALAAVEDAGNEVIEVDVAPFQEAVAEMVDGFRGELGDVLDAIDAAR